MLRTIFILATLSLASPLHSQPISMVAELVKAIKNEPEGATIKIGPGTFELSAPLEPKAGMSLEGAGKGKTILTHVESWKPSVKTLPDPEMKTEGMDTYAYLIRLKNKAADITISDLTLRGPQMHGAIFGNANTNLHIHDVRIEDTLWSGIRTFRMRKARIHDCEFIDAGGRWKRGGKPGVDGGITGGAIFAIWMKESEIFNNRFTRTQREKENEFYGVKVRQGKQSRIHHNTIEVNFSIELPFENDEDVEIDHNILHGTVSIPKNAGGPVPESGRTFHIHHNYFKNSYAIEFVRNGVEISHNLFDFDTKKDHGNLISGFGKAPAKGPAIFHNNLVSNPGRGVIWINEPYSQLTIRNNHIITRPTVTPRTEGLFGFHAKCDFSTFLIANNIVECIEQGRNLLRRNESYAIPVRNNRLINVTDTDRYENEKTGESVGLEKPLSFRCGVNGELTIDGWQTRATDTDKL
ncbi:MAG: right-handed parallel beta-helix repeat-containing protein [Verrucomicrobiota bacterium]